MLSIDLGIGLTSIAVAVRQATNYATTWSFAAYAQANGGALPGPWADVRRTGTATYENASGVITTLPDLGGGTYAARVQYRSGTARGLLIEGQTTQYLKQVDNLSGASWSAVDLSISEADTYQGRKTWWLTKTSTGTGDYILQSLTLPGAGNYGFLVRLWGDASTGNECRVACVVAEGPSVRSVLKISGPGNVQTGTDNTVIENLSSTEPTVLFVRAPYVSGTFLVFVNGGDGYVTTLGAKVRVQFDNAEAGSVCTSYIPNSGTGTVVRAADSAGVFLTSSALSAAFPGGVGQPWTTVFQYIKGYSVSSDETLFALSAGSSAGSTNLLALQTNGTQAQAVHSGGSGTLSGTLVHDGSTVNKIALSVDPTTGKVSVSVNGAAAVETTGIAFTGSGTTHLIPGARTTGGSTPVLGMEIYDWRNVNTSYTTGASLQALSA
jgi:hypothetical protein